MKWEIQWER